MKQIIRLTESDLHRIIENTVSKVIKKTHKAKHRINEAYTFNQEKYEK